MTYALNLIDLACTLYALSLGCYEMNPLMQHIPFQIFYKVVIVGALCWWLSNSQGRIAKLGLHLCTVVYGLLCGYHIVYLIQIGGDIYGH